MSKTEVTNDVSIIGASVVGGACAAECAKLDLDVSLIEEHNIVGKDRRCTGIYSVGGLERTGIPFKNALVNTIYGAIIHSPTGEIEVKTKDARAHVLDRQILDENSVNLAVDRGAKLYLNSRVSSFSSKGPITSRNNFKSKYIVGADGAVSFTARSFDFPKIQNYVYCYEAEYTNADISDSNMVDVYLDSELFSGFFGWTVPCGENKVRIGFGVKDTKQLLAAKKEFLKKKEISAMLGKAKIDREFFAPIPIGQRSKTQKENVILVGDAAGQVKATTGGGVVFGSLCAQVAANSISNSITNGVSLNYESEWKSKYQPHLYVHKLVRSVLGMMNNQILDLGLVSAKIMSFNKVLETFGDMDFILKPTLNLSR